MQPWRRLYAWVNKSIARKLIAVFIVLIVTPVLTIGIISFKWSEGIILDKVGASAAKTLDQASANVNHILNSMIYVSNSINLNDSVKKILSKTEPASAIERWADFQTVDNLFASINSTYFPYAGYFTIIGENGLVYTSWFRDDKSFQILEHESLFEEMVTNQFLWIPSHANYASEYARGEEQLLTMSRYIVEDIGLAKYGVFIVSVPHRVFFDVLENAHTTPDSKLLILDETNEPILYADSTDRALFLALSGHDGLHPPSGSFVSEADGASYMVNYHWLNRNSWKIVELVPYESLVGEIVELRNKLAVFLVLFLLLFLVISMVWVYSFTTPIRKLYQSMRRVERGDWSVRVESKSHDEIGLLVRNFNHMVGNMKSLVDRLYEEQEKKRELEMEALQAQIEPHFLFNTLNSIRWVAVMSESENVSEMIGSLTHLLKMRISTKERDITIEEELENVKHYILLQKVRYNTRFDMVMEVDSGILSVRILKLILQPIVENAILHGLDRTGGSTIAIRGYRQGGDAVITVSDNGKGMDEKQLQALKQAIYSGRKLSRGIGLSNVNQRLVLSYGETYGLAIQSEPGRGTTVAVRVPIGASRKTVDIGGSANDQNDDRR